MSTFDPDLEKLVGLLLPGWRIAPRDPITIVLPADAISPPLANLRGKYAAVDGPICYQPGPACVPGTGSGPGGLVFITVKPSQAEESFGTRTIVVVPATRTILAMEI